MRSPASSVGSTAGRRHDVDPDTPSGLHFGMPVERSILADDADPVGNPVRRQIDVEAEQSASMDLPGDPALESRCRAAQQDPGRPSRRKKAERQEREVFERGH